jgi:hypothetical protein
MIVTRDELKAAHNNVMTIMESRIMAMVGCDRRTANLVANEVLSLDNDAEYILSHPEEESNNIPEANEALKCFKKEVEDTLGVPLKQSHNGDVISRSQARRVAIQQGGSIGGDMIKRMIQQQEQRWGN